MKKKFNLFAGFLFLIIPIFISGCSTTFKGVLPSPVADSIHLPSSSNKVRVALKLSTPEIKIKVVGPGKIYNKINRKILLKFNTLKEVTFTVAGNGVILFNNKPTNSKGLLIQPDITQTIWVDGTLYRGNIELLVTPKNTLLVVNKLGLEEYIMGVVPKETFASWPDAALKSQAVAARTFAIYHIKNHRKNDYDIVSPIHQLYGGMSAEDPRTTKAILETEGEILTYDGDVLCTFFYTCCGGQTEKAENIFKTIKSYPDPVKSPYCKNTRHYSWKFSIAVANVEQKLKLKGKSLNGPVIKIQILKRFKSGRISQIKLSSRKKSVVLTGEECRNIFGYNKLRSTLFNVKLKSGRIYFSGRGWGHAVGLCQWCSKGMADKDINYEKILYHFYPGSKIKRP
ncbi:MAG: SpoIID/LytB domain-containing protein [Alphaproteobacteria bacterium]